MLSCTTLNVSCIHNSNAAYFDSLNHRKLLLWLFQIVEDFKNKSMAFWNPCSGWQLRCPSWNSNLEAFDSWSEFATVACISIFIWGTKIPRYSRSRNVSLEFWIVSNSAEVKLFFLSAWYRKNKSISFNESWFAKVMMKLKKHICWEQRLQLGVSNPVVFKILKVT